MRSLTDTAEAKIAEIAGEQHGVVTRRQLLAAGLDPSMIKRRVRRGSLIPEFRGTYRVGHRAPNTYATYFAAVAACGGGAFLAGEAAGHLLGILTGRVPSPEVIAPIGRTIDGIRTKRGALPREEVTIWRGIPTTNPARTLVDLAAARSLGDLARACHEAGVRYGTTPRQVNSVLARRRNATGAANIRRVIEGDAKVTLSVLERTFLRVLREGGLDLPQTNRPIDGHYVDCRWPEHKLTVELDSYTFHNSRYAWERDRQRARRARARGDEFRRYTTIDVLDDRRFMLRELRKLLPRS
jgi:very-short-patch-repair endonuclease